VNINVSETKQNEIIPFDHEKGGNRDTQKEILEGIDSRIRGYLESNRGEVGQEFIQFQKSILKRMRWSILMSEHLSPEVGNGLECFANQKSGNIGELIEWIALARDPHPPSLEFFNTKFNKKSKPYLLKRIETFLKRTTLLLQNKTVQHGNDEIVEYVKILINHLPTSKVLSLESIDSLLGYLKRTGFEQLSLIIETALDIRRASVADFITTLMFSENLLSIKTLNVRENIKKGVEVLLHNGSDTGDSLFVDVVFDLLRDKKNISFIENTFKDVRYGGDLLWNRVQSLLSKIINQNDGQQSQRIDHLIRIVVKNDRLVTLLQQNPLLLNEKERLVNFIFNTYEWSEKSRELSENIQERMGANIFNPLFYDIELFFDIAKGGIQEKIIEIFLNVIQHDGQNLVDESRACHENLEKTNQLIKTLLSHFNREQIFKRKAQKFLKDILNCLVSIAKIRGKSHKKIEMINKVLNTCLEVKLEHIGRLAEKEGALETLCKKISEVSEGLVLFETLEERINLFEKSFSHQLFAQLYSDDDFKEWFKQENPLIEENILTEMQDKRISIEEKYHAVLKKNGFEYIHNNQVGALTIVDSLIDSHNIFLKLGTGQGKSLIAEMSAIRLLGSSNPPKRVFIFTSYDHLAKRDHQEMEFLSTVSGYPSIYLSSSTSFQNEKEKINNARIIHIDSECFHSFLSESLSQALDTNQSKSVSEIVNFFFKQEESAVILDEGDLMILDDPGHRYLCPFSKTFNTNSMNMNDERDRFDSLIGSGFIQALNDKFSGSYNNWYDHEKQKIDLKKPFVHEASGKTSTFAECFAQRIKDGKFTFSPLLFNFSAFVRSFRNVLFLSGSIHERNVGVFQDYFTNGKNNFYANIPLFFGSHNWSKNLIKREQDKLDEISWHDKIVEDIEKAIGRGQPTLLFSMSKGDLEVMQEKYKKERKFSSVNWITITDEESLENNVKEIGKVNTITFATMICGRGIDIKIDKTIELGLHVLITKLPANNNERLLTQMIGRTARLDRKGSVSIIVKESLKAFEDISTNNMIEPFVDEKLKRNERELELSKLFLNQFSQKYDQGVVKRWIIYLQLIHSGHINLLNDAIYATAKAFIGTNILN